MEQLSDENVLLFNKRPTPPRGIPEEGGVFVLIVQIL